MESEHSDERRADNGCVERDEGEELVLRAVAEAVGAHASRAQREDDPIGTTQESNGVSTTVTPPKQDLGIQHEVNLGGKPISCRVWQVPGAESAESQHDLEEAIGRHFADTAALAGRGSND